MCLEQCDRIQLTFVTCEICRTHRGLRYRTVHSCYYLPISKYKIMLIYFSENFIFVTTFNSALWKAFFICSRVEILAKWSKNQLQNLIVGHKRTLIFTKPISLSHMSGMNGNYEEKPWNWLVHFPLNIKWCTFFERIFFRKNCYFVFYTA